MILTFEWTPAAGSAVTAPAAALVLVPPLPGSGTPPVPLILYGGDTFLLPDPTDPFGGGDSFPVPDPTDPFGGGDSGLVA